MGTNYYARTVDCAHCGSVKEVHLGKSSGGWTFTFQYNDGEFYKTVAEMKKWLVGKQIYNEYGEKVSQKKFWDLVKLKQEKEKLSHSRDTDDHQAMTIDGYSFINSEFC